MPRRYALAFTRSLQLVCRVQHGMLPLDWEGFHRGRSSPNDPVMGCPDKLGRALNGNNGRKPAAAFNRPPYKPYLFNAARTASSAASALDPSGPPACAMSGRPPPPLPPTSDAAPRTSSTAESMPTICNTCDQVHAIDLLWSRWRAAFTGHSKRAFGIRQLAL